MENTEQQDEIELLSYLEHLFTSEILNLYQLVLQSFPEKTVSHDAAVSKQGCSGQTLIPKIIHLVSHLLNHLTTPEMYFVTPSNENHIIPNMIYRHESSLDFRDLQASKGQFH